MTMSPGQSIVGSVRLTAAACLLCLSFPLSQTAALPSAALQRIAEVPSSVFEVLLSLRNVFPAANFNRDVTTNWWETEILDGQSSQAASDLAASLKITSFIVLDQDFYQVCMRSEMISPLCYVFTC